MKRVLTTLTLLCTLFVLHAQDCVFQFEGKNLDNGATVTIYAEEDPLFGWLICDTNPSNDPNGLFLLNKTSKELSCSATISIQSNTLSNTIAGDDTQWCMGTDCMPIKTATKSKDFKLPANAKIMTKFETSPTKDGEMLTKLEVRTGGKTYTVNIRFVNGQDRVTELTTAAVHVVEYYTLDGRKVNEQPHGVSLVKLSNGQVRKVIKR